MKAALFLGNSSIMVDNYGFGKFVNKATFAKNLRAANPPLIIKFKPFEDVLDT